MNIKSIIILLLLVVAVVGFVVAPAILQSTNSGSVEIPTDNILEYRLNPTLKYNFIQAGITVLTFNYNSGCENYLEQKDFLEIMVTDYKKVMYTSPAEIYNLYLEENINETLNMSLDANYLLTQSITNTMTASLIVKEAKIAGDTVKYEGQEETIIGYDLLAPAHSLKIEIVDSSGATIKTFEDLDKSEGQYKLAWDFTDDNGNKVSVGDYKVEITAKTRSLKPMEVAQYFVGIIEGVSK